jgi:hypothetical protein
MRYDLNLQPEEIRDMLDLQADEVEEMGHDLN